VVVSADGGVDLVPNLRPAIDRAQIDETLAELRAIYKQSRVGRQKFEDLLEWTYKHRFYLREDDCLELNELIMKIDAKIEAQDPSAVRIVRHKYVHNPELDESLYYRKGGRNQ